MTEKFAKHPSEINIEDYDYVLPEDRIAFEPLPERDASKLLIYKDGNISEDIYRNLANHVPEQSLLVFNNTRVIHARFLFPHGAHTIELFCLEPLTEKEMALAMQKTGETTWLCFVGNNRKWKEDSIALQLPDGFTLKATRVAPAGQAFQIRFSWTPSSLSFSEVLEKAGHVPLPPYIKRQDTSADTERYQTVYAEVQGSVAAPTAGLHFTPQVLASLEQHHIQSAYLTLHVGAGTFKPVTASTLKEHEMHAEWAEVSVHTMQQLAQVKGPIISVGTTSLRTLESLYWLSQKLQLQPDVKEEELSVGQWEPYALPGEQTYTEALQYFMHWCETKHRSQVIFKTQIIIAPGYILKAAQALITNFHQPKSTLLLLVGAVVGEDRHRIYDYALSHQFRFLSYGDGSLLWRK